MVPPGALSVFQCEAVEFAMLGEFTFRVRGEVVELAAEGERLVWGRRAGHEGVAVYAEEADHNRICSIAYRDAQ